MQLAPFNKIPQRFIYSIAQVEDREKLIYKFVCVTIIVKTTHSYIYLFISLLLLLYTLPSLLLITLCRMVLLGFSRNGHFLIAYYNTAFFSPVSPDPSRLFLYQQQQRGAHQINSNNHTINNNFCTVKFLFEQDKPLKIHSIVPLLGIPFSACTGLSSAMIPESVLRSVLNKPQQQLEGLHQSQQQPPLNEQDAVKARNKIANFSNHILAIVPCDCVGHLRYSHTETLDSQLACK